MPGNNPNPESHKSKKPKVMLKIGYGSDTVINDKEMLIAWIKQEGTVINVMEGGKFDNGKEYVIIKISGITP